MSDPLDIEAIRARNRVRDEGPDCECTWRNGGFDVDRTCPHDEKSSATADIDTLIAEVERLRALASEIACFDGPEAHDHALCHDIAKSMRAAGGNGAVGPR